MLAACICLSGSARGWHGGGMKVSFFPPHQFLIRAERDGWVFDFEMCCKRFFNPRQKIRNGGGTKGRDKSRVWMRNKKNGTTLGNLSENTVSSSSNSSVHSLYRLLLLDYRCHVSFLQHNKGQKAHFRHFINGTCQRIFKIANRVNHYVMENVSRDFKKCVQTFLSYIVWSINNSNINKPKPKKKTLKVIICVCVCVCAVFSSWIL